MPELPDIAHFQDVVRTHARGRPIRTVALHNDTLLEKGTPGMLEAVHDGDRIADVWRRGKYLGISFRDAPIHIVLHFGMTGSLERSDEKNSETEDKYRHLSIIFDDKTRVSYINKRKLGRIFIANDVNEIDVLAKLGPDPLSISKEDFLSMLAEHERQNIKSFLMDQEKCAGIGNEYSDEILFRARIDPHATIGELDTAARERIYELMQEVLTEAIAIGPPDGTFPNDWLVPHRVRGGDMQCPLNSSHDLTKGTIAGRSAVYCPIHQATNRNEGPRN